VISRPIDQTAPLASPAGSSMADHPHFATFAPFIFVFFWSTGFIGAKYGLPYAEPFTYMAIRMALSVLAMAGLALILHAPWPSDLRQAGHAAVTGLLMHGLYLGGVFYAISRGMPAGLSSLVVGLQPILVAFIAQRALREGVRRRQWIGLALGFGGVAIVVIERMRSNGGIHGDTALAADIAILLALVGTTLGTVYQKRFGGRVPLLSGTAIQYAAAMVAMGLLAVTTETMDVDWTPRFIGAMAWQVIVLSVISVSLLMILIKQNSVSRVSSFLYLVPPLTAIEAYFMFDERLSALALVGMAIVVAGVYLVVKQRQAAT
jgi:drug/metabolite transporter (DMT)-like permease